MEIQTIGLIIGILILAYIIIKNIIGYYKSTYISENGRFNKIKFENMMIQYLYVLIVIFFIIFILTITASSRFGRGVTFGTAPGATARGAEGAGKAAVAAATDMAKVAISTYPILILGFLVVSSISFWTVDKMTLNERNCANMDALYPNGSSPLSSYTTSNEFLQKDIYLLYDYYIKTAYNCCCPGNYKNDYVNLCALKDCINTGVRCLDFEIYAINNAPVIASSSVDNFTIKETYNSIPFLSAMEVIRDNAFSSGCPCSKDPLFLNFRVKSKLENVYNEMAKDLSNTLAPLLLDKKYSYQYKLNGKVQNFGKVPLKDLKGKVIIMIDGRNSLYVDTALEEYINIASSTPIMQSVRYDTIKGSSEPIEEYINYNKEKITMCLPNLSSKPKNYPSFTALDNGCQFVAMCFQKIDSNLDYYNKTYFKNYPIMLKPPSLRLQYSVLTLPTPRDPNYNFTQGPTRFTGVGDVSFTTTQEK